MDWVWTRAKARGNVRLVLLAVADKATGPDATARIGTAELGRRIAAHKGTTVEAVAKAIASGELELTEAAKGSRAALYRLPLAVGHTRGCGLESGPETERSGIQTTTPYRSGIRTATAPATGLESGPVADPAEDALWSGFRTGSGLESGPHQPPIERMNEGVKEGAPALDLTAGGIPPFARPLVDQITAAEVYVGWDLTAGEWLRLDAMVKRSGVDMLARHAVTLAARRDVSSARYFLRAWTTLPPAPTAGTVAAAPIAARGNVIPLDRAQPRSRVAQSADYLAEALAAMEAQQ
jgi:hypothetical protein